MSPNINGFLCILKLIGDKNLDSSGGPDFQMIVKEASNNLRNLIRFLEMNEEDLNVIKVKLRIT